MAETIRPDQRVAIVGKTGSGKTYALRLLARGIRRLVVLDGKGTLGGKEWNLTEWNGKAERQLKRGEACRIRVPAPVNADWEPFLWRCYEAGNVTILIDELNVVCPASSIQRFPALWSCFARGREFNVGVWFGVQRPKIIPLDALAQADWFLMFSQQLETDRKRMAEVMGETALSPIRDAHGFYLYSVAWETPRYYKAIGEG